MKKEHYYNININGFKKSKKSYEYIYSYGSVQDIKISINRKSAEIYFSMKTQKEFEDFSNLTVRPFKDAYIKVHLLAVLLFGIGFESKTLCININDISKTIICTQENFPIVVSMLGNKKININWPWIDICKEYCTKTKTSICEDLRFTALYAFLLSKTREYEYDKFQNLWTSLNAVYTFVAKKYELSLREKFGLTNDQKIRNDLIISARDSLSIGALAYIIGGNYKIISPTEAISLNNKYFETEKILGSIKKDNYERFYEECLSDITQDNINHDEKYMTLSQISACFEVPVYVYLLLGYPYHWRCKYLHGNYIAPLFVEYNSDEVKCLKLLNYFMDRFLSKEIPAMFKQSYWTDEKYYLVLNMLKKCNKEAYKKYENRDIVKK